MIDPSGPAAAGNDPVSASTVQIDAPAKVNLFLEVHGRRADGFHEIATLMLAIDLVDRLELALADELSLAVEPPGLSAGPENLVWQALAALRRETGCRAGAAVRLTKRIPWNAGLGGGSSDAAAALMAANRLWKLGLSREELSVIARGLGSDVPFFLSGSAAWCTGRGDIIEPVSVGAELALVLLMPPFGLRSVDVYARVRVPSQPRDGADLRAALARGDVMGVRQAAFNRLEEPAAELQPLLADWRRRLERAGGVDVRMSGSGTCLYAIGQSPLEARQVYDNLSCGLASEGLASTRAFLVRSWP